MIKGIVRKIDELGRVVFPKEYRTSLNLNTGDRPEIVLDGQVIRVKTNSSRGMTRPVDELGRIALPIEFRRALEIGEYQEMDMYIEGDDICICKATRGCGWCGSSKDLLNVNDHHICIACAAAVTAAAAKVLEG